MVGDQVKGAVARQPDLKSKPQLFCAILCSGWVGCVLERQHCHSNPLLRVVTLRQKLRSIAPRLHGDYNSIRRALTEVIALQALAQTLHGHSNRGIALGVKIWRQTEKLDSDYRLFEHVRSILNRGFDQIGKESLQLFAPQELATNKNMSKCFPPLVRGELEH